MQIMNECAEALGCVTIKDYIGIMRIARQSIYDKIHDNKINTFDIGEHRFPLINYKL